MCGFDVETIHKVMLMPPLEVIAFAKLDVTLNEFRSLLRQVIDNYRSYIENIGLNPHPQDALFDTIKNMFFPDPSYHAMLAVEYSNGRITLINSYAKKPKVIIQMNQITYEEVIR